MRAVDVATGGTLPALLPAAAAACGKDSATIVDDDRVSSTAGNASRAPSMKRKRALVLPSQTRRRRRRRRRRHLARRMLDRGTVYGGRQAYIAPIRRRRPLADIVRTEAPHVSGRVQQHRVRDTQRPRIQSPPPPLRLALAGLYCLARRHVGREFLNAAGSAVLS